MKKRISIFFVFILCVFFVSMYYVKNSYRFESPEATVIKCFNSSGAKVVSSEIYFWGRLEKDNRNISEMRHIAEDFADNLGVLREKSFSSGSLKNDFIEKIEMNGMNSRKQLVDINVQIDRKSSNKTERTISGSINQDSSNEGLEEISKKLLNTFKKYKIRANLNTCIVGNFAGKLSDTRLKKISSRIFEEAEAKKVEGITDNKLISVSAYSPVINDSIKVNGKRVNLNLAIRYNSYENKTYIWLATPVITKEY